MVNQIMTRNLDVPEIRKFEAMLRWATNKSKLKPDPDQEFKHIMDRLKKDIDLMKIAPQDLIRVRNYNISRLFFIFSGGVKYFFRGSVRELRKYSVVALVFSVKFLR